METILAIKNSNSLHLSYETILAIKNSNSLYLKNTDVVEILIYLRNIFNFLTGYTI